MTILCFRTTSSHLVDMFINHPDVRATIEAGDHKLESLEVLTDWRNVVLCGEGGGAVFLATPEAGVYDGHIFLLKGHRGARGLAFGKAALGAMFGLYEASKIVANVPWRLSAARMYVRKLGFSSVGDDGRGHEQFVMEKSNG